MASRNNAKQNDETLYLPIGIILYNNSSHQIDSLLDQIEDGCNFYNKKSQKKLRIQICIKNNGKSGEISKKHQKNIVLINDKVNVGFSAGHNKLMSLAFKDSRVHSYLCMNPDIILDKHFFKNLIDFYESEKNSLGLLEALQFPEEHPKPYNPATFETPWASGCLLLITRAAYEVTQGFDDNFFMYCEDVDLSWRVRMAGLKIKVCPTAIVCHSVESRAGNRSTEKEMFLSARQLANKWGARDFIKEMEKLLVNRNYYPEAVYLPKIYDSNFLEGKNTRSVDEIIEFRQMLSFSLPRWQ